MKMSNQKSVGIITISIKWLLLNYGSFFQHFALRRVVSGLGFYPVRIAYDAEPPSYVPSKSDFKAFLRVFWHWLRWGNSLEKEWLDFSFHFFRIRRTKKEYERLIGPIAEEAKGSFASVVIGGDQIFSDLDERKWGSDFIRTSNVFTYSASADWQYVQSGTWWANLAKDYFARYKAVSLRETAGCQLVKQICPQLNPVKMPDPVFFLPRSEYDRLACRRRFFWRPTLLVHIVNWYEEKDSYVDQLEELASGLNVSLKIIGSQGCEKFIPYKYALNVGPRGYLKAVRDAEYFITNSFHGLVFALIYHKRFVFVQQRNHPDFDQNERQRELLEEFNLSNRAVTSVNDTNMITNILHADVPSSDIEKKIQNLRNIGLQFLRTNLTGGKTN